LQEDAGSLFSLDGKCVTVETKESLLNIVNASGFSFQLGVEHEARFKLQDLWRVVSTEHAWRNTEDEGFIDIVLQRGALIAVIECKRTRNGTWIFLTPSDSSDQIYNIKVPWVAGKRDGASILDWDELRFAPPSSVSAFCVVRGSGEGERSLLERLSSQLIAATDCLINEDIGIEKQKRRDYWGIYLPMIVTNADLQVCKMDLSKVSLDHGDITDGDFKSVQMVRFHKSLVTVPSGRPPANLTESAKEKERGVLIVNSKHFSEIFHKMDIQNSASSHVGTVGVIY
jgi:hypothetical protein